jgi:hypothetical protein
VERLIIQISFAQRILGTCMESCTPWICIIVICQLKLNKSKNSAWVHMILLFINDFKIYSKWSFSWVYFCTAGISSQGFIPLFFLIYTFNPPPMYLNPQGYLKIIFILRNFLYFNLCFGFCLNNLCIILHLVLYSLGDMCNVLLINYSSIYQERWKIIMYSA